MPIRVRRCLKAQVDNISVLVALPQGIIGIPFTEEIQKYQVNGFIVHFDGQFDEETIRDITLKLYCALDVRKVDVKSGQIEYHCAYWDGTRWVSSPEQALDFAVQYEVPEIIRKLAIFGLKGYSIAFSLNVREYF